MHSTLRQRRKLRELEVQFDVKDTATLVAACNRSKDNHEQHDAFLDWIENYVRFFEQLSISDSHQLAMEFVQLADVVAEDARTKELVRNAFCCLCSKIRDNNYGEEKLILALCYFLLSVDCQAFEGNPHHLTRLARDLITKLGPEATFSRGTYPTHSVSLFALHHLCAVIHEVDPAELDHGKRDGLFQLLDQCLGNIISTQYYYPFSYQATLTRQSLASMDSHSGTSSKEIWYRMFHAMRGIAYFYHALAEVATLKIDVGSFDKSVEELTEAFARHKIESKHCFEIVQELINFRMLVQKNPDELDNFKKCLSRVDEILEKNKSKEDQLALRYTMIRQVTLLALDCPSKEIREWAVEEFFNFSTSRAQNKGWIEDERTLEALLDAMLEIQQLDELANQMAKLIDHMKFYFRTEEQSKTIANWIRVTQWKRDAKRTPKSQDKIGGNVLFQKVKAKLSLDESASTSSEVQRELKKKYKRESEVPSLFDNGAFRHVQALHHSLMLHQKVRKSNGEEKVEKTPIDLEDLFKDRELSCRGSIDRVKQVLLFGNPGTGKTTIAKKIAYLWSIGEWGDSFDFVYLVPVRELVSIKYDDLSMRTRKNLQTAITNICFPGKDDDMYRSIKQQVEEDLDKDNTLVMFDGLDEGEKMTKEMMKSLESKSCRVLVLSRPRNLQSESDSPNVEVECKGMSQDQLIEFIKSETSSNELAEHLQRHPSIWKISHVPVIANVLTFLYNTKKESIISEESNLDMFSLYWKMSIKLWDRFIDKKESNMERNQIFEALEEIAFRALEDGQVLIDQDLVHEISYNRQMREVLKDCGFLLLKKEGFFYQFPHLTFQEFFAGQYVARSLMNKDEELKQQALGFLEEHKYCANFRQMLCFMIQACIVKKGAKGYHEMELFIEATPIALGYKQHLVLNLELLEAALSASKRQDWEKIMNSTKVLEIALESYWRIIWGNRKFSYNPFVPFRNVAFLASIIDDKEKYDRFDVEVFAKAAKVARYNRNQWNRIIKMLKSYASRRGYDNIIEKCRESIVKAIPKEKNRIQMLPWERYDSDDECASKATVKSYLDVGRSMAGANDETHEAFESSSLRTSIDTQSLSNALVHVEELPKQALNNLKPLQLDDTSPSDSRDRVCSSIKQLAKSVRERRGEVIELIREWCDGEEDTKLKLVEHCTKMAEEIPEHKRELVELLWTLCEDDAQKVCNRATEELTGLFKFERDREDFTINALLMLSESEPHSSRSSLVQLVGIAYDCIEGTQEDLNHHFSNLSQQYMRPLYENVTGSIGIMSITKSTEAKGLHLLHLLCLKALKSPEVEKNDLLKTIDEADAFPNKVVVMSTILMSIPTCPMQRFAPNALRKLARRFPEHKEEIFNALEELTRSKYINATSACVMMFSVSGREPQRVKRTMSRFKELIQRKSYTEFVWRFHLYVSLGQLLRVYMECRCELLIPFIVRKFFNTPVTMKTMSNGSAQLIIQESSDSKKTYSFKTAGDAEVFRSIVEKCTERQFQEVASLIWSRVGKRQSEDINDNPSSSKRQCVEPESN